MHLPAVHVTLRTRLLAPFGAMLLLSLGVSIVAYLNSLSNATSDEWVRHTEKVIDSASRAQITIENMESSYRDYLLTGSDVPLATYRLDAATYPDQLEELAALTADNPAEVDRWRAIEAQTDSMWANVTEPGVLLRQRVNDGTATMQNVVDFDLFGREGRAMVGIDNKFADALAVERQLLTQRSAVANASAALLLGVIIWGSVGTVIFGLVTAFLVADHIGSAMRRVATTAQAIAAGDLGRRIALNRSDEIGQAAAAFDAMADTLQRDINERLQMQAETESILNSAAEGIYAIDAAGRTTIVNPAASRLTGYSMDELRGKSIHKLIHHSRADGSPLPQNECQIYRVLSDALPRRVARDAFWRKDGAGFPVEYAAVPICQGDRVRGVVVTFHDISERLVVERMKDEFVSVVSHELRTPLTSIRGSLGLLAAGLMGPISDKAKHMLDVALSNTDRLIRLINDILDIERIESGRVPMQMRPTDAHDLVMRSIEAVRSMADAAKVSLVEHADSIRLVGDPDRILQTLTNLIGNAIKFSSPASSIDISAVLEDGAAHFAVRDQGRGIPAHKLESIFGRFEQVDASDSREKGGTGLGLSISRSIVQQHGGRIWAESTVGLGSTFHFLIPLGASNQAAPENHVTAGGGPTILIVDDDPDVLQVVSRMLAHQGYQTLAAQTGDEALALAQSEQPAAVLLDLAMPGMSGWQTLSALKAQPRTADIPVLVLSGLERTHDERTEHTEGWIAKPVTPETLRDMLGQVLHRTAQPGRILIVEDDVDLARVLTEVFARKGVETQHATTGEQAIELSTWFEPDLLLLDLALPDRDGSEVVDWFRRHDRLRRVALVVYTARDLSEDERDHLHLGPTEHLIKSRIAPEEVRRRVLGLLERVAPAGERRAA